MRTVSTLLGLSVIAFLQLNCTKDAADVNSNQPKNTAIVQTANHSNANVKPAETPLPTYTNADEALAEGKKLLDNLETEKAIDALTQATKLNPDLAEAHFNLGIAYALVEKDEDEKAMTEIEVEPTPKTAKASKKSKNPKKNAAPVRTKNSEKAFENAIKAYKKILAKNPKDDVSQFNLGRAYSKLNEDEDAAKALREAVKLEPEDGEYQTELGAVLIKLAKYDDSVAALKKAVKLDESNLQAADLLEKAQSGKRRIDFGNNPKPLSSSSADQNRPPRRSRSSDRDDSDKKPAESVKDKSDKPNANQ